jgi:hypothetical protein
MNQLDLIVDALENAVHNFAGDDTESKCVEALAAAHELRELQPVAWVTTEQFASTAHNVTRVTLHQDKNGIPLYALKVTK